MTQRKVLDALAGLLKSPRHDVPVDAARTLLECGWGKPAQAVYSGQTTGDELTWEKFGLVQGSPDAVRTETD